MPLWSTASGPPPPMAEGGGAEGSGGLSSGAAAIRSLLPTRRRLRLDPPSKLYFPCTYMRHGRGTLLSRQFGFAITTRSLASSSSASWRRFLLSNGAVSPPKAASFEPSVPLYFRLDWIGLDWALPSRVLCLILLCSSRRRLRCSSFWEIFEVVSASSCEISVQRNLPA